MFFYRMTRNVSKNVFPEEEVNEATKRSLHGGLIFLLTEETCRKTVL